MALQPARQICQTCGLEDYLSVSTLGPGLWRFECANPRCRRPDGKAMAWESTTTARRDDSSSEGKAEELGLYQDLLLCLVPGEPYVEYGVVEHRYAALTRGVSNPSSGRPAPSCHHEWAGCRPCWRCPCSAPV